MQKQYQYYIQWHIYAILYINNPIKMLWALWQY